MAKRRSKPNPRRLFKEMADALYKQAQGGRNPSLDIPVRSLSNVRFNEKKSIIEMGKDRQKRYFFNVAHARKFMQTFLVASGCKTLLDEGKTTSIRDLYYMMKHTIPGTKEESFGDQNESDPIIEDLEVALGCLREELHLFASNRGSMVGTSRRSRYSWQQSVSTTASRGLSPWICRMSAGRDRGRRSGMIR